MNRIMRALRLDKIAAVDRPCQEGAVVTIMKRAPNAADLDDSAFEKLCKRTFTAEQRKESEAKGHAMPGGRYPIENKGDLENAIHAIGRGKGSHAAIREHIVRRAKALGATDVLPDEWNIGKKLTIWHGPDGQICLEHDPEGDEETVEKAVQAFATCVSEIHADNSIIAKGAAVTTERADFVADLVKHGYDAAEVEKAADELAAIVADSAGSAGKRIAKGVTMIDAIKKALGLSASATEADVIKAAEEKAKKAEEREKDEKRAEKIAKMSDKHKAFMDNPKAEMPKGGKEAFGDMEPSERDSHISAHPIADDDDDDDCEKSIRKGIAFKALDGSLIRKKDVGDAAFALFKSQNDTIAKQQAEIAKAVEEKTAASFEKRATDLGFAKEFGATLRKAYGGDATAQTEVEKQMSALRKQAETGGLFGEFGKRSTGNGSAYEELVAKGEEIRKSQPKLSQAQAFSKAYTDRANAEIVKRYKAEQARAAN